MALHCTLHDFFEFHVNAISFWSTFMEEALFEDIGVLNVFFKIIQETMKSFDWCIEKPQPICLH